MDNHEVLVAKNFMQGWLSLVRYLIKVEECEYARAPNPGLTEFAARACASAFTTLLRNNSKQACADKDEASESLPSLRNKPSDFTALQDAIMGVQGELGVQPLRAEYCTVHGGLKSLLEELVVLKGMVSDQFDALNIGAIRLEMSLALAQSIKVKTWMEQTQGMGGGKEGHRIPVEMEALMEGAFTQMTSFVIDLKDKLDIGGGMRWSRSSQWVPLPCGNIYRPDLQTHGSPLMDSIRR